MSSWFFRRHHSLFCVAAAAVAASARFSMRLPTILINKWFNLITKALFRSMIQLKQKEFHPQKPFVHFHNRSGAERWFSYAWRWHNSQFNSVHFISLDENGCSVDLKRPMSYFKSVNFVLRFVFFFYFFCCVAAMRLLLQFQEECSSLSAMSPIR